MAGSVDVVIVNWNSHGLLQDCLDSLARFGGGRIASVVVVDNGSVDGSAEVTAAGLPLEIIRTGENLGFGRACNLGAREGRGDYILLLNPDAAVHDGSIDQAAAYLDDPAHTATGVVGIKLIDRDGHVSRNCARLPSGATFVGGSLGLSELMPRRFPPVPLSEFDHLTSRPVDHVIGAFYLIRRSLFEALGGFDERFFVYLEDLDLSQRVKRAGYAVFYLAEADAYHREGGTSEQVKAHRLFYSVQSRIVYAFKHFPRGSAIGVTAAALVAEPVARSARAILRRSPRDLWFTWRGYVMLYAALPGLLRTLRAMARPQR